MNLEHTQERLRGSPTSTIWRAICTAVRMADPSASDPKLGPRAWRTERSVVPCIYEYQGDEGNITDSRLATGSSHQVASRLTMTDRSGITRAPAPKVLCTQEQGNAFRRQADHGSLPRALTFVLFAPGGWKYHCATVPATTYTRSSANSSTCARFIGNE